MRFLIYMLAMLTGFSAAEAARPVGGASVAQSSAVVSASAKAATILVAQVGLHVVNLRGILRYSRDSKPATAPQSSLAKSTPVSRADVSRQ